MRARTYKSGSHGRRENSTQQMVGWLVENYVAKTPQNPAKGPGTQIRELAAYSTYSSHVTMAQEGAR